MKNLASNDPLKELMNKILASLLAINSTFLFAAVKCKSHPQKDWIPLGQMQMKALDDGYGMKELVVEGSCYKLYGVKGTNKVEAYFDMKTGKLVKSVTKEVLKTPLDTSN
ncbi:MAG: PepSY domain-containing protein [Bdellovibrionota bacterium]